MEQRTDLRIYRARNPASQRFHRPPNLAQACNTGFESFTSQDIASLRRDRVTWVEQNFMRDETLTDGNARLVSTQNKVALARTWDGGDVASADSMRFIVLVRTVHTVPNMLL